jgi:hypothetical protein
VIITSDTRNPERRTIDERVAAEPQLSPPQLPSDAPASPVEAYLARRNRRPVAVEGVVENGVVRPVDPAVKLLEHSRVIIVATEGA